MSATPPPVQIETTRQSIWHRFSIVWVIPLLALLIALAVAWQSYNDRGPLIEIAFANGAGVAAKQTELRYRDVTVGVVETVKFSDSLDQVIVEVRLDKDIAPFVDEGAKFWVVRPQVTSQGITGLSTVLSGVFIEGSWDSTAGEAPARFRGLDDVPLIRPGQPGLQIALRSGPNTSLTDNAPILFRGIEVGRIGRAQISRTGSFAVAEAIIYERYRHLVSTNTRFWDISGFDFSVGASGAELNFQSISSLLSGGLTFETIVSGGDVLQDGQVFEVYDSEKTARASVFNASDVETLEVSAIFADNVAGLTTGAAVELKGLKIGEVTALTGVVDRTIFGDSRVRLNTTISIQPARLGLVGEATPESALAFLREQVDGGLRARLASASLLTGGLKIELITDEQAVTATILEGNPFPILPTMKSDVSDAGATAEGVLARINNLPVEELMASAIGFLDSATALVSDDALRETPQDVRNLIGDMRGLVGSPETQKIPAQLSSALAQMESLLKELETSQAVAKLSQALDATSAAANAAAETAGGVDTALAGLPDLIKQIDGVAAKAFALDVEALVASANDVMKAAETLISSDETAQLPASLASALEEVRAALKELREGGAIENTNQALASARKAADAIAVSAEDIPEVVARLTRVLNQASATLQSYDGTSEVNRNAREAMRDIQKAADAIAALARTIQRNPNSLLLGR